MKKILITHALESERTTIGATKNQVFTLITGVGKVAAAVRLTNALHTLHPDFVINIGTAGTFRHQIGDILICRRFIDREYETAQLPGLEYRIDNSAALQLHGIAQDWKSICQGKTSDKNYVVNTGDNFVTEPLDAEGDVFDMESYAEAMACREANIPFISIKYITDIIGQNSIKHWEEKLADAQKSLTEYLSSLNF